MCSIYHKGRNVRYFSLLIAKTTTAKEYYQRLFGEKERERVNKSSKLKEKWADSHENCLKMLWSSKQKSIGLIWWENYLIRNSLLIKE